MTDIINTTTEAYIVGATQKFRKEKWAYDHAKEAGAVTRYEDGIERLRTVKREGKVTLPTRKRDIIEAVTVKISHGVRQCTPRMMVPTFGTSKTFKLSPNARIRPVHNVCSPYRAIRAAIENNPYDMRAGQDTYNKKQERARKAIAECDSLAHTAMLLDQALMDRARFAVRANAKARADFRALCHRLARFSSVKEALEDLREGERGIDPKGPVNSQVCQPASYYIERVRQ